MAKPDQAQAYLEHLRRDTFPQLRAIRGFVDATILRRNVRAGVEFLIVTRWETMEAIRAFASEDAETAVVPDNVRRMMVEFDERVRHYEVVQA